MNYNQPQLLKNYNKGMGGVDLHDNAVQNYSVGIRAKKWYWPLWISTLNSSLVNAWKLDCFRRRYQNQNIISQKEFRVDLAYSLMVKQEIDSTTEDSGDDYSPTPSINVLPAKSKHLIVKIDNNKKWRCKYCHKPSSFLCKKCNVALHTHCFEHYHEEK